MQWTLSRPQWFYCSEAISPQDSTIMKPPYHHSMHCDYTLQHQPETKQSLHLQCEAHKAKYCVYSSFQMQLNFLADAVLLQHVSGGSLVGVGVVSEVTREQIFLLLPLDPRESAGFGIPGWRRTSTTLVFSLAVCCRLLSPSQLRSNLRTEDLLKEAVKK